MSKPDLVPTELRRSFLYALHAYRDKFSPGLDDPEVDYDGRLLSITAVFKAAEKYSDPLPKYILEMLYDPRVTRRNEARASLKADETYRGGARHLLILMIARRNQYQVRRQP